MNGVVAQAPVDDEAAKAKKQLRETTRTGKQVQEESKDSGKHD